MSPQALLVYNPHAGPKGRRCSPEAIATAMEGWGWTVERHACASERTIHEVRSAVERGCEHVVAAGGDGTLNLVVNGMAGSAATLGVVPCGSANDFARSLDLPLEADQALEVIRLGRHERLDLGWVNGRHFMNAASLGLSADIARDLTADRKRRWGRWAYVVEVATRMRQRRLVPLKVCLEATCETVEAYQVTIANGSRFGGGFRVSSEATFEDGLLDVVLIEPGMRNLARGAATPGQTLIERIGSRSFRVPALSVGGPGRVLVSVDGESLWLHSPLMFKVVPRSLSVCTGRPRGRL